MKHKLLFTMLLLLTTISGAMAQGFTAKGVVLSSDNEPVIGAVVFEKGTDKATSTDVDGSFTLVVNSPSSIIEIRYAGARTVEIEASKASEAPIVLEDDAISVAAVAVVGYGTLRKSDLTGSVNVVAPELDSRGMVNSASEMLMGKVPGLQITLGSGRPGDGSQIRIRGGSSLNASNNPLIVIDGVPIADNAGAGMTNPLGSINPNDIASFTVLKDASAAAIYGSRGANGVIIITTKKGSSGANFRLSYNSDYSVSVNSKTVSTLSPGEYREFLNEYWSNNANVMAIANQYPNEGTDWQSMIYRPAFGTNQYLSGSGRIAGKHTELGYRASFGYTKQDGTIKGSDYNRYTLDIGLAPRFFDNHLSVDVNFKGTLSDQNNIDGDIVRNAAFFDPTKPVYQTYDNGLYNGYYTVVDTGTGYPNSNAPVNPMAMLNEYYSKDNAMRMIGNVQVDYKMHFLPALRANLNVGYDASIGKNKNGVTKNSEQAWRDGDFRSEGRYNKWTGYRRNSLLDFYLNYNEDFNGHRVDVMAGYSWQHFYTEDNNSSFPNNAINEDNPFFQRTTKTENYLVSFFGRANYSYKGRYMVTATLRNDGSSRFSKTNRWGLFPSVALGWNLAEESWLKNSKVNNLKIRGSWGITGQQDIGTNDYPYLARYNTSTKFSQYQFGNQWLHLLKPIAYDENIKWEETTSWNIGLDFAAFQNRLTFSLDLYKKYTKDLLNKASVPAGTNFSNTVYTNVGDMKNKGIEVSVGGDIIRNNDWTWNVSANFTYQDNKITRLTSTDDPNYLGDLFGSISIGTGTNAMINAVGYTPSSYYLYEQVYDSNGKPLQNTFVDRNGDGVISNEDRYVVGNAQPKMYFGWSTSLSYRKWDLSINAHGSFGYQLYNDFRMAHSSIQTIYSGLGYIDNITPTYRETGFKNVNTSEQNLSDYWLEDASFMRIDNITLGYNFSDLFGAKGLNGRLSFTAQNPFLFTKYSGIDPESSYGIDGVIWPRPRIFLLGLSLNF